ncbi:MAG: hypothetical protein ACO21B_10060 [Gemmobacter sp.]
MLWLLLLCFAVGLVVVALFSRQGRGCLAGAAGIAVVWGVDPQILFAY